MSYLSLRKILLILNICNFIPPTELVGDNVEETLLPHEVLNSAISTQKDSEGKIQCYCVSFCFFFLLMLIRLKCAGCEEGLS